MCSGLPFPFLGILFGKLVDDLNSASCDDAPDPAQLENAVRQKVILVAIIAACNFLLIYVYMGCWTLFGERLIRRLRTRYLAALLRQEAAFFDTMPAGEVASRLSTDLQTIQAGVSEKVGIYIASLSYFLAAYAVAFIMDARLAMILFTLVPVYWAMTKAGNYFTTKYSKLVNEAVAEASSIASECLSNIQIVHAFRLESRLEGIFAGHLLKAQPAAIGQFITAAMQLGALYFVAYTANAVAIWQGSQQIADAIAGNGSFTVGRVYTCILILVDASFILTQVAPFLQIFSSAAVSANKLFETIERDSKIDGTSDFDGQIPSGFEGGFELQNVRFRYPSRPDAQVLDDVSLSIEPKKITALVGSSGSGKSTLASLLPRIYDLEEGEGTILVDGMGIKEMNARFLRSNVAIVEQNPSLFDVSILENIAFGMIGSVRRDHLFLQESIRNGTLNEVVQKVQNGSSFDIAADAACKKILRLVEEAASRAGVTEFVNNLEHGLATQVGPGGRQLSGGQKQRVAIARALVRDAPVLILDEATSALDSFSEQKIQKSLEETCQGKTIVTIAHRLATVKNADKIIVMAKGKVEEEGGYNDLLEKGGLFASLVKAQDIQKEEDKAATQQLIDTGEKKGESSASGSCPASSENEKYAELGDVDLDSDDDEDLPLLDPQTDPEHAPAKAKKDEQQRSFFSTFVAIIHLARRWRLYIVIGVIAAIIVGGSNTGEALIFGNMISHINPCEEESIVRWGGIFFARLFFLLAVLELSASVTRGSAFGFVSEKLLVKTRILTLRSLLHQDVAWHESEGRTPDTLLSYITSDTNSLSGMTGSVLGISFSIVVSLVMGITISHIVAWKIAVVLLATVPILLLSGFLRLRMLARFHEQHAAAFSNSVAVAKEAVDCIQMVAAYALEDLEMSVYGRALKAPYDATLKGITVGNFWLALSYSISNLVYALAYWWGAKQTANGTYTQTQFFIVLPALLFSAQSCGQFFSLAPDISRAGVGARRILDLIDRAPRDPAAGKYQDTQGGEVLTSYEDDDYDEDVGGDEWAGLAMKRFKSQPRSSSQQGMSISFDNVRFSYPSRPNVEALKGLTLSIKPNQFAALTGPSGSGKSTTLSLLERFYRPSSGTITLDGKPIHNTPDTSFRDDIALVPQDSVLFDGTIRFNIALGAPCGAPAPSDAAIEAACRAANIHDTIASLPEGYDTRCGTKGSQFSGGQRQRLAIARALLRNPRLLLLDEPTSALDAESERVWQTTLDGLAKDITVVVIAHRLATIRKADVIFLIEGGRCVDSGSHEELFGRSESYKNSVLHQTLR
ncbi:Putative ABC transporter protein [Macrophomina phaseolina MS6]|uniref:Putative ABC transporter protein n=1 Tax=Macrophomina phaseolina (strain MS6) TaxID=1126212 RepID=K2RJX4_MACPH|nr:Putative ABC transporter protein [Macrophomina phaseolina MS6]